MKVLLLASFDNYYCADLIGSFQEMGASPIDLSVLFLGTSFDRKSFDIHRDRVSRYERKSIQEICSAATPCFFSEPTNSKQIIEIIQSLSVDVCIQAGVNQILKKDILIAPKLGVINVHPGWLPRFRGCSCVEWAIYFDQPICNSAHFCDEGIDTGPIIHVERVPLEGVNSYRELRMRTYEHGQKMMVKSVEMILQGVTLATAKPQGEGKYHKIMREPLLGETIRKFELGHYSPSLSDCGLFE